MKRQFKAVAILGTLGGLFLASGAFAEGSGLSSIVTNITDTFKSVGELLTAAAYLVGFFMVIIGIFKFKQHKDNPQQTPMGTAITIFLVGILLIFIPSIIQPAAESVFGSGATAGGSSGSGFSSITTGS